MMIGNSSSISLSKGTRSSNNSALIINLFGGPGIGKTTLAARMFFELKTRGVEAACPEEYAKIALWQGRDYLLDNQLILLGRTWDAVTSLSTKVDVIVLDSPVLLCSHYAGDREPPYFHDTVLDFHRRHDRLNLLLSRNPESQYSTNGRRETSQQAIGMDRKIQSLLETAGETYTHLGLDGAAIESLVDEVCLFISSRNSGHF